MSEKMLCVVFLVNSVPSVSWVFFSRQDEFTAYPKAFMYPKVENDTQNAPKTTIQARVPPSGNFVVDFSSSTRSGPLDPRGMFWLIDSCVVDIPSTG